MKKTPNQQKLEKMQQDVQSIHTELTLINKHRFLRAHNSIRSSLLFMFAKGVAFGLGSVIGATLVVSVLVYLLSQIEFLPVIGEWVSTLLDIIQQQRTP